MLVSSSRLSVSPPSMIYNNLPRSRPAARLDITFHPTWPSVLIGPQQLFIWKVVIVLCTPGLDPLRQEYQAHLCCYLEQHHFYHLKKQLLFSISILCSVTFHPGQKFHSAWAPRIPRASPIRLNHEESYPQPGTSSPIPTSQSHYLSISTAVPMIHYSSHGIKSLVHLVKVNTSMQSLFYPKPVDGIPAGIFVDLDIVDGLFSLYTTSLWLGPWEFIKGGVRATSPCLPRHPLCYSVIWVFKPRHLKQCL